MIGDNYWGSVSLLLQGAGTAGSTTFTDSSDNTLTVTAQSTAALSATNAKFNGMSIALGATGWFSLPTTSLLTLTGNFTIEYFTSGLSVSGVSFCDAARTTYLNNNALSYSDGSITALALDNTLDTWKHIAVTRSGTTVRVFENGALKGTGTTSATFDLSGGKFGQYSGNLYLLGSVAELRISKGFARYTAAFTAPTLAFEAGPVTLSVEVVAPVPSVSGFFGSNAMLTSPMATVSAIGGGYCDVSCPTPTLYAYGHDSAGENAADITAPLATLAAYLGMTAKLKAPTPAVSATATGTNWLKANVTAPMATLEATGTVSGTSRANITAPMATLIGYGGMVCNVTITGHPTLDAHVTSGGILNASITGPMAILPLFEVTAEAYCNADIIAPMGKMGGQLQAWITAPMATLTAVGSAVVTATYEAYAVNLNHTPRRGVEPVDETTRYTNFPFTHVVRYQNSYYGANSTGLYLLEGTTDAGTTIPWAVKTAMTDFDSPTHKTVASAYFGGRLGPEATVTLHAGEGAQTQAYSYTTPRGALAQNYRQVFGKGIRKHRYYALAASGSGEFELDDIELDVVNMTRRI